MITLASIAISLTVGLVLMQLQYAHGIPGLFSTYRESKVILRYCYEHADRPNPVQDLIDKGILTPGWFEGETCATVKQFHDTFTASYAEDMKVRCHYTLKEDLGHEPSELAISNCADMMLEYKGIK